MDDGAAPCVLFHIVRRVLPGHLNPTGIWFCLKRSRRNLRIDIIKAKASVWHRHKLKIVIVIQQRYAVFTQRAPDFLHFAENELVTVRQRAVLLRQIGNDDILHANLLVITNHLFQGLYHVHKGYVRTDGRQPYLI